ncbi:N-terminal phage integrase SAM-like domain-containing protein [Bifidobacterium longum]|uniref:N-terminal phage integrase SAM-like domain-containing protein n=1 Tax=Bifidobacterium longum TaxID=216816 RepID=UPI001F17DD88|nr:N-terminal phage integrase SAM-like domain-containing protein [Bifidobacterium longum]
MLLNEYWDESYWPSCGRLRECTRVGYASAWRRHIRPELGDMDLADLTGPRIQSWLDSITSAGAAVRRGPYCGRCCVRRCGSDYWMRT